MSIDRLARPGWEPLPIGTGLLVTIASAVLIDVLAVVGIPRSAVFLAVAGAGAGLVGGLAMDVRVRRAWAARNRRHRDWLDTQPTGELVEFRRTVVVREREVDRARRGWRLPLVAAVLVAASALLVPYALIGSLVPSATVVPLTSAWLAISLPLALVHLVIAVLASLRDEAAEPADDPDVRAVV